MPPEITRLTEAFLHNPVRIEVARASTAASTIRQGLVASHGAADKRETLRRLIREAENLKMLLFFVTVSVMLLSSIDRYKSMAFLLGPCTAIWINWPEWRR